MAFRLSLWGHTHLQDPLMFSFRDPTKHIDYLIHERRLSDKQENIFSIGFYFLYEIPSAEIEYFCKKHTSILKRY